MSTLTLQQTGRQQNDLTGSDRRLLLKASLRLLSHRLHHNIPVTHDDLLRLVPLGDDGCDGRDEIAA